ncbi:UbiH/UbiF family hydroxylase [Cereibacter sp. SYSU M97828]|nr:UbiH/UbiF family hydroxylase [Cereibacter flavus]
MTDILISGGGVAGLTAAAAFGSAGYEVVCVDPAPPVTAQGPGADQRSTAFLQPSIPVLQAAGLWDRLFPQAAPLQVMRIVDAGGERPEPRLIKEFDAAEISDKPFGWNLPNWLLRREMVARLAELPNVRFLPGTGTARLLTREAEARVTLTDGQTITARLVVGADGRDSPVREQAGIGTKVTRFGQKALAFSVTHPVPHNNVSTEVHRTGGPFTLVPLPSQNASAIVWMETGPEVERLRALPAPDFEAAMNERSCGILGDLTLASPVAVWPIILQTATRMSGQRTALIAEAAHVLPPIGAQGLNMSLADIALLLELGPTGDATMLETYHRRRHADIALRARGIEALNRASMLSAPLMRDLRAKALDAMYSAAPIRRGLMRAGLGVR